MPVTLPLGANENWPTPANDNYPRLPSRSPLRGLGRFIPWIGVALTAAELARRYTLGNYGPLKLDQAGYHIDSSCPGASPQLIKISQSYPACGVDYVINLTPERPSPTHGFVTWEVMPVTPYMNVPGAFLARGASKWLPDNFLVPNSGYSKFAAMNWPMLPMSAVNPWPTINPATVPILQPTPVPLPVPWSVSPHLQPGPEPLSVQYEQGYAVPVGTPGLPAVSPPEVWLGPSAPELGAPGTAWALSPRGATRVAPGHRYERPPRRTRERKFIVAPGTNYFIRRLFDAATETEDFIDVLYKHTKADKPNKGWVKGPDGKWYKVKPTIQEKTKFIYDHVDKLNVKSAFFGLIDEYLGDLYWGAQGRLLAKAARETHRQGLGSPSRSYSLSRRGTAPGASPPTEIGSEEVYDYVVKRLGLE